jgi:hypothetical protein
MKGLLESGGDGVDLAAAVHWLVAVALVEANPACFSMARSVMLAFTDLRESPEASG